MGEKGSEVKGGYRKRLMICIKWEERLSLERWTEVSCKIYMSKINTIYATRLSSRTLAIKAIVNATLYSTHFLIMHTLNN